MNISEYMTFDEDYFGHNLGFHTKKHLVYLIMQDSIMKYIGNMQNL